MIQQNLEEKAIFKDIPGYEGLYTVSNMGDVKSLIIVDQVRRGC